MADHYVLGISTQQIKKFGGRPDEGKNEGFWGKVAEVRRHQLDSNFLTPSFTCECAYQQKCFLCVTAFRHRKTSWAVYAHRAYFPSLQTSQWNLFSLCEIPDVVPSFPPLSTFISVSSCRLPVAKQASSRTRGMVHSVAPVVMQTSAQGFCVQEIQLKNNYQKISASPVRLYCLNRCFLFIWYNNRMLFLIKEKKKKQMKKEKEKKKPERQTRLSRPRRSLFDVQQN